MTCKDCIHYEACDNADLSEYVSEEEMKVSCPHFKNKAEFVEVKHGEWEFVENQYTTVAGVTMKGVTEYRCSVCGHREIFKYPYCNCGAKMDGGNAE